ncbi:hypothetical protein TKK_0006085 [Trichogramma kaykai]
MLPLLCCFALLYRLGLRSRWSCIEVATAVANVALVRLPIEDWITAVAVDHRGGMKYRGSCGCLRVTTTTANGGRRLRDGAVLELLQTISVLLELALMLVAVLLMMRARDLRR